MMEHDSYPSIQAAIEAVVDSGEWDIATSDIETARPSQWDTVPVGEVDMSDDGMSDMLARGVSLDFVLALAASRDVL